MPDEFSRTTARKKILLPSGDTINVPVITKISFTDPFNQHQEYQYLIDNTENVDRRVHVDNVHPVNVDQDGVPTEDTPTADTSQDLFVERIEVFKVVDPFNQYQESQPTLDNTTGNDLLPPHFSNHQKTHIYRYHKDPHNPDDNGVWIDSELIDELAFIDPFEQYQERQFALVNPTNAEFREGDLSGQASEDDPDLTIGEGDGEGTEDNPVRLDPFQNIVNYSSGHYLLLMRWRWFDWHIIVTGPPASPPFEPPYTIPSDLAIELDAPTGEGITLLFDEFVVVPNNPVAGCNEYVLTKIYDVPNPQGNFTTDPEDCFTWTGSMTGGTSTSGSGSPNFEQRYTKTPNTLPGPPTPFITDSYEDVSVGPYPSFLWNIYSTNEYQFDEHLSDPSTQAIPIEYIGPNPTAEQPGPVFIGTQGAAAIQKTPQSDHFYQFPSSPPFPGGPQGPDGTYKFYSLYNSGQFEFKLASLGIAVVDEETTDERTVAKIAAWPSLPVVISIADGSPTSLTYPPVPSYSLGLYSAFGREWLDITGGNPIYKFGGPTIDSNLYPGGNP